MINKNDQQKSKSDENFTIFGSPWNQGVGIRDQGLEFVLIFENSAQIIPKNPNPNFRGDHSSFLFIYFCKQVDKKREGMRALKWNKMMRTWDRYAARSSKVKARVYKGIPDCVRGEAWKLLANSGKYVPSLAQAIKVGTRSSSGWGNGMPKK